MVSSTFTDLKKHRAALIRIINDQRGLKAVAMENDSAKADVDVIDSSLQMVRDSAAYVGVISLKYGQTPICPSRNPAGLSITELEFNEAQKHNRPVLLFIMGADHSGHETSFERDPVKKKKLDAFRQRAKRMLPGGEVDRVYAPFESLGAFKKHAEKAIPDLARFLEQCVAVTVSIPSAADSVPIPKAPKFYAAPAYIGLHPFVGRREQLETLSEWAAPADSHPLLLFEAIGGTGKSMLTWHWTTHYSSNVRSDWAGRFWYSFYEKGAVMADFCQRALAYMTGRPVEEFREKKTGELTEQLLDQLRARPWLFILDGIERVLVHYHRFDAAQLVDEEAGTSDQIASRDPCAAIRPEDDDLLRALAGAEPSKLLVTSRLVPRVLLNSASQALPGVLRVPLPGLRPADAEALFRACGITGNSQDIQVYLKNHCDCHPLVTGVLAGLVNDYLPDRGNFDKWASDQAGGGRLNLASLSLVQKHSHILNAALDLLPEKGRQLLSTLALLSESIDYATLSSLNPYLPPEPKKVVSLQNPAEMPWWKTLSGEEKEKAKRLYRQRRIAAKAYERDIEAYKRLPEVRDAPHKLQETVRDLERRGLLPFDQISKRHDLHPVVRGLVVGRLAHPEREQSGQRVLDHLTARSHRPYDSAEHIDDLRDGLQIVRVMLQMGRREPAAWGYVRNLSNALLFNLEAHNEILELLRPLFPFGWDKLPEGVHKTLGCNLSTSAAIALDRIGARKEAMDAYVVALRVELNHRNWDNVRVGLSNIASLFTSMNKPARRERCLLLAMDAASLSANGAQLFRARLDLFYHYARIGNAAKAVEYWNMLDPMGRNWPRPIYRPGHAEEDYATFLFWQGKLTEQQLALADRLAVEGKNRGAIRCLHTLRGEWHIKRGEWVLAAASLHEAVRMTRANGQPDSWSETWLALAKYRLGQLDDPGKTAKQLAESKPVSNLPLAELWFAIGDLESAKKHAIAAYRWAWADGEPFTQHYDLMQARALLESLGAELPVLNSYDSSKGEKLPWEEEVVAAIKKAKTVKKLGAAANPTGSRR